MAKSTPQTIKLGIFVIIGTLRSYWRTLFHWKE
jgi:hypothetical protein